MLAKRKILIAFALGILVVFMGISAAKTIKVWAVPRPHLPGQLLVSANGQLIVLSGSGDTQRVFQLPELGLAQAEWSPDKQSIAFITSDRGLGILDFSTVITQPPSIQKVFSTYDTQSFSWSPQGDKIALVAKGDSYENIYLLKIIDLTMSEVWTCAYRCGTPIWSFDGKQIVFPDIEGWHGTDPPYTNITSLNLETGEASSMFRASGTIDRIRWSPDQARFALIDFSQGLFISDNVGNWRKLADSVGSAIWSPDGKWLAYTGVQLSSPSTPAFVYIYSFESGQHFRIYPKSTHFLGVPLPESETRNFVFDWRE